MLWRSIPLLLSAQGLVHSWEEDWPSNHACFPRLIFGTLYPAYSSYKAVKTKNVKEYVKWMMYWIVFAFFTTAETLTDIILSWFPFYFELKIAFVIWLLSPYTKGSSVLYRKFVHPTLSNKEKVCPFLQLFLAWPSKDIPTPPATDISYGWPEPAVTWQSLAPGGRHCLCTVVSTGNLPAASPLRSLIPLGDRRIHHTSSRQEL